MQDNLTSGKQQYVAKNMTGKDRMACQSNYNHPEKNLTYQHDTVSTVTSQLVTNNA